MITLKPSLVLRRIKAKQLPAQVKGGVDHCSVCNAVCGSTESPDFWENGMYVWCEQCKKQTLVRPKFPPCPGYPEGFEIDLSGERKKYPLVLGG